MNNYVIIDNSRIMEAFFVCGSTIFVKTAHVKDEERVPCMRSYVRGKRKESL